MKLFTLLLALFSFSAQAQTVPPGVSIGKAVTSQTTVGVTVAEVSTIQTIADTAGSLSGDYFLVYSPSTCYYVWIDVANGSTDPAVSACTGIETNISSGATIAAVGDAVQAAVEAHAAFTATDDDAGLVTITNVAKGNTTNIAAGTSGFTPVTLTPGVSGSDAAASFLGNLQGWRICNNAINTSTWLAVGKAVDPETDGIRLGKGKCLECPSCTQASLKAVKVSAQAASNGFSVSQFTQ